MNGLLDFGRYPLAIDIAAFVCAGALVWAAGTRLSHDAAAIAQRTGIGQAVIGMLLLGAFTSLPEIAVAVTAALDGVTTLTVNNLIGGAAMQVGFLALTDALLVRRALTHVVAKPSVLLQGSLANLMLVIVIAGVTIGDRSLLGVGLWCWMLPATYITAVWIIARARDAWVAEGLHAEHAGAIDTGNGAAGATDAPDARSLAAIVRRAALAGGLILVAGFILARSGDAIATRTSLGASFVGAVMLALCTSLPELSTVYALIRIRRYVMAVSEIFGSVMFNIALIFLVDAVSDGAPVLTEAGRFSAFAALLVIALITLYMIGLVERRNTTVLRMGLDSIAVAIVYTGGLLLLYQLR